MRQKESATVIFILGMYGIFSLGRKFDACIAMFAVMGYVVENSDVISALRNIRAHLKQGGLFVFDVWNGLAVMRTLPETRVKEVEDDDLQSCPSCPPYLKVF